MNTREHSSTTEHRFGPGSRDFRRTTPDTTKEKWLQTYASQILKVWAQWQTPLGVATAYIDGIKQDLIRFYDDPLMRTFIEASY
jgi:hypothetical protein